LNETVSCEAVLPKPLPKIVICDPVAPAEALIDPMLKAEVPATRVIDVTLPLAS
jgi:hypothetical protein